MPGQPSVQYEMVLQSLDVNVRSDMDKPFGLCKSFITALNLFAALRSRRSLTSYEQAGSFDAFRFSLFATVPASCTNVEFLCDQRQGDVHRGVA